MEKDKLLHEVLFLILVDLLLFLHDMLYWCEGCLLIFTKQLQNQDERSKEYYIGFVSFINTLLTNTNKFILIFLIYFFKYYLAALMVYTLYLIILLMIQAMVNTFLIFYIDTNKNLIVITNADLSDNKVYEGLEIV
jgi:hypothetical protein